MDQAGPSRRAVLVGAGVLAVVAACSPDTEPEPLKPDPDLAIRALAADGVRRLVALYDGVTRAHPGLRAELAPLAAETAAHLSALEPPAATPSASTAASKSPSATPSPTVAVPATAAAARTALVRAERHEAELRITQLASASAALARLLAAIGASEATHATLLRAGT
jgi:hypothetical protein